MLHEPQADLDLVVAKEATPPCRVAPSVHRVVEFAHRGHRLTLLLPACAEALIDEAAFAADERLPYWADLWPSAVALARHLLERPLPDWTASLRALELGCGVGLVSLALVIRGCEVTATDYEPAALRWLAASAQASGLPAPITRLLDWRQPDPALAASLVVASDVLYEERNVAALAGALSAMVRPDGAALLADPGRRWLAPFLSLMRDRGWSAAQLERRREPGTSPGAADGEIQIVELRPPGRVLGSAPSSAPCCALAALPFDGGR